MALPYDGTTNEYKLDNPPNDCIQSVKFGQNDNQHLLTASWDSTVRLYDVASNVMRIQYNHEGPVLDVAFQGTSFSWSGGADNKIKKFDFQSHNEFVIGYHDSPVRSVEYISECNLVATGGWDSHLKLWDPRLSDCSMKPPIADHTLSDKIYTMSVCGDKLIVGTASRQVLIWDLRNMTHVQREAVLKHQIRCIDAFADKRGYVVSSIEGRVAVEYLDPIEAKNLKYAFKCHRNKDPTTGVEMAYPVNTISFHQKYNTFATGGSDGFVSIWDGKNKKRLVQFHRYPTSISSLCFSPDGSTLAIASSHVYAAQLSDGSHEIPPDSIYIRKVSDHEARNKN